MKRKHFKHVIHDERITAVCLRTQGKTLKEIGKEIHKDKSSVSRLLKNCKDIKPIQIKGGY
jgi:predicted transcriptional regulator